MSNSTKWDLTHEIFGKKKDEIDMQSSPLSIEFADGVPQTYHKSTLRVSLSEQIARDEVSRKRPTLERLPLTRALEGFFFLCWNLRFRGRVNQLFPWFSHELWQRRFPHHWMKGKDFIGDELLLNFGALYYYVRNFCNLIGLEQWYFSLIWNTYMWKLQTFWG